MAHVHGYPWKWNLDAVWILTRERERNQAKPPKENKNKIGKLSQMGKKNQIRNGRSNAEVKKERKKEAKGNFLGRSVALILPSPAPATSLTAAVAAHSWHRSSSSPPSSLPPMPTGPGQRPAADETTTLEGEEEGQASEIGNSELADAAVTKRANII